MKTLHYLAVSCDELLAAETRIGELGFVAFDAVWVTFVHDVLLLSESSLAFEALETAV